MNLYQLLTHIPHDHLQRLAEEFGLVFTPSKRNLLQAINARYRDVEFMRELVIELPYECRALLRAVTYFTHGETITISPALASTWIADDVLSESIHRISATGLIFPQDFRETRRALLPFEARALLREIFKPNLAYLEPVDVPSLVTHRGVGVEAAFQLLCVLQHLRVRKTQKGMIPRKLVENWVERIGASQHDEARCQFTMEYALRSGLVEERNGDYSLTPRAADWTSRPASALHNDFWLDLLESRVCGDRRMQACLAWLAGLAEAAGPDAWKRGWRLESTQAIQLECFPEEDDWLDKTRMAEILRILQWAGLVALDQCHMPSMFALRDEGVRRLLQQDGDIGEHPDEDACILQPNFELLIPPSVGYTTLWRIDQLAEFIRRDVMTEYRISQERILVAMRSGWTTEAVLSFLNRITGGRIPDIAAFSLKEWCAKYGRVRLRRMVVMECDTPELAEEILHVPNALDFIQERISPNHFLVEESDAKALFRLLRERGYEPSSVGLVNGGNGRGSEQ